MMEIDFLLITYLAIGTTISGNNFKHYLLYFVIYQVIIIFDS